jgi:hypothetical protein
MNFKTHIKRNNLYVTVSSINTNQFMLFREIIAVCCEKYETRKYTMLEMQSAILLN